MKQAINYEQFLVTNSYGCDNFDKAIWQGRVLFKENGITMFSLYTKINRLFKKDAINDGILLAQDNGF